MPRPLSQDYNEAIQSPASSFADTELRQSQAATNALGLPIPCSGNFADVYKLTDPASQRSWAVKCFTRQIPGLRERYQHISHHLAQVRLPFMVAFTFLEQGIRVRGDWSPILKMEWVEGLMLNQYVRDHLHKPDKLATLCQIWVKLAHGLRQANIAHCDLQHGNVLLVRDRRAGSLTLKLVDYDGMCVPALTLLKSIELGHPAYQHPQRLREGIYSLEVDRFSNLVIFTALRAIMVGGKALWDKYDNGDNLLFKQPDFEAPGRSPLFGELLRMHHPDVRALTVALIDAARKPLAQTPLLETLVSLSPQLRIPPQEPGNANQRTSERFSPTNQLVPGLTPPGLPVPPSLPMATPIPAGAVRSPWDFHQSSSVEAKNTKLLQRRTIPFRAFFAIAAFLAVVSVALLLMVFLRNDSSAPPGGPPTANGHKRPSITNSRTPSRQDRHTPADLPATRFALKVEPAIVNVSPGGKATFNVSAIRKGYDGPIAVEIPDLPAKVTGAKVIIPAGKTHQSFDIVAGETAPQVTKEGITVIGTALADNKPIRSSPFTIVIVKTPIKVDASFVPLFNGKDLTGWKPHLTGLGEWRVANGAISYSSARQLVGLLSTMRDDYSDFHLRLDTRLKTTGGTSWVCFRKSRPPSVGYQINIHPNATVSLSKTFRSQNDFMSSKRIGTEATHALGEWTRLEVIAKGNHLTVMVNEQKIADLADDANGSRRGFITLAVHKQSVEFRKIEIKEMKPVAVQPDQPIATRDDPWLKQVAALPLGQQIDAVTKKLKERNPGFDGKLNYKEQGGVVTHVFITAPTFVQCRKLVDISPVRAFPALRFLLCDITGVSDLSALNGMKLNVLSCQYTQVSDLTPLKGMPLTHLLLDRTKVSDLSPLKGMKLTSLMCQGTLVSDLTPLMGMELTELVCNDTKVTDLSPLKGMPLTRLQCDFDAKRDATILRSITTLELINSKDAKQFWKEAVGVSPKQLQDLPRAETVQNKSDVPRDRKVYIIRSVHTHKRLAIQNGSKHAGSGVVQDASPKTHVVWQLRKVANCFRIVNTTSGLVLHVPGRSAQPNVQIQQRKANNYAFQGWEFVKAGDAYFIRSIHNKLVLDVAASSEKDGAAVIQYPANAKPTPNQLWILSEVKK